MNDYTPLTNDESLSEFNNDYRSHCFVITITNDNFYENSEDFFVELSIIPGLSAACVSIQPNEATVRIVDSDSEYTYMSVSLSVSSRRFKWALCQRIIQNSYESILACSGPSSGLYDRGLWWYLCW